jgi:hypothetical protein
VVDELHANIEDAFNGYGAQIMSSQNYEPDPKGPKNRAPRPTVRGAGRPAGLNAG